MPQNNERGNAFMFVLLGVVLFAALAMVISRSMRSETVTTMSNREAALAASEILEYAQKMERAVNYLRRKNISENDLSFDNDFVSGYSHAQPDTNKIFNSSGGRVSWQKPIPGANDGMDWVFTGSTCIADIGTGATGCDSDGLSNEELIAVLPNINETVCGEINSRLGITGIPSDSGGGYSGTKFTGSFADGTEIILDDSYDAACFAKSGYHFYAVILAR